MKRLLIVILVFGAASPAGANLVAHWRFDEGSGNVAYDSAGDNDGAISGAQWTTGQIGGALTFDGVDDYVQIPDADSLTPSNAITISFWIKNRGGQFAGIYKWGSCSNEPYSPGSSRAYALHIVDASRKVQWRIEGPPPTYDLLTSEASTPTDQWCHVTGTFDQGKAEIYIDAQLAASATLSLSSIVNDAHPLIFGGYRVYCGSDYFQPALNGSLDDVRIYDRALAAIEIQDLYGQAQEGLVAHWRFDEGSGLIAYDSAGNNDGVVYGAQWTTGQIAGALDFDGVNDYVQVQDDPSLDGMAELTVCAWFKPGQLGRFQRVVSKWENGPQRSYVLSLNDLNKLILGADSRLNLIQCVGATTLDQDRWYHGAGVYDRNGCRLFIDGRLDATAYEPGRLAIYAGSLNLRIGAEPDGTYPFGGPIDDVRIYNRALSAEGIRELYGAAPPAVYHIDGVAGNDLNNGLSRETAFKTIQKGIEASDDGDEVVVWPGLYQEAINFKGKAIAVESAAEPAVIEAAGMDAVTFHAGEGPGSVLKNFIIRNSGMAISTNYGSSPTISNLTIVSNDFGIAAYEDSDPNIGNCIIWDNEYGDLFGCEARYSWVQQELEPDLEDPNGGLVSHWAFDEGAGLIAYDSAGNKDGVVFGAKWASGQLGGALDFDGVDDYVALPDNNPIWLPQNNFTISAWVYFDKSPAASGGEAFLDLNFADSGTPSNELGYVVSRAGAGYAGRIAFGMTTLTNTDEDLYSNEVLSEGRWYHVVAVRSGTTQAIYLNGKLDSSRACSPDPIDFVGGYDDDKVNIGRVTSTGVGQYYVDGKIDDVRIYNRALSASEILQLYEPVAGIDPLFADPAGGDYHLLSERGRYWPVHDIWVLDRKTSPCIDGGDPAVDPSGEPMPNGGRINIGAYGGTIQASMSEWPIASDYNRDGRANFEDLALFCEEWLLALPWAGGQAEPPEPEPDLVPPTPSPMMWDPSGLPRDVWIGPDPTFGWAVAMTSAVASDPSGPMQYYFESFDEHAYDSGWIGTRTYTTGVVGRSGQLLRFRVKARDAYHNETAWSPAESSQPPSR